ncbi:MAG: sigma-70 family RNA polymerase sigma factor [Synechococcus sp.]
MDQAFINQRNQMVLSHLGLARHVSRQEQRKGLESYEDLLQEAYLGLLRGVDNFNPDLGFKPSSYLVRCCRGQILHYRRDRTQTIRVPWRLKDLAARGRRLQEQRQQDGLPELEADALAKALGVTPERWAQAELVNSRGRVISLDAPPNGRTVEASSAQDPQRDWLAHAMGQLEAEQRSLLLRHYVDGISLRALAEMMALSPSAIRTSLRNALGQLRQMAEQSGEVAFTG